MDFPKCNGHLAAIASGRSVEPSGARSYTCRRRIDEVRVDALKPGMLAVTKVIFARQVSSQALKLRARADFRATGLRVETWSIT